MSAIPRDDEEVARPTHCVIAEYDGVICDLDGVVYRGPTAVPGAVEAVNHILTSGVGVTFLTNNASRPPEEVADHLTDLGVEAGAWSVVTSSQSAAMYLADQLPSGAHVLAVGGPGVAGALTQAGLVPVRVAELADKSVLAMVQGLGVDVTWRELAEIGHLARQGVTWVATNLDVTLPTARGPAPGNGALVGAVQATTAQVPHVTGKPGLKMFELARARLGTEQARTLVCGDRLDTDIAGANAAGLDSLFVLSGASTLQSLAFATEAERPTYLAADLRGVVASALRLRPTPAVPIRVTSDGLPRMQESNDRWERAHSVVTGAWAALDEGVPLSHDVEAWTSLERLVGLGP